MSSTAGSQHRTKTKRSRRTGTSIRRRRSKLINVQRHKGSCGPIAIANAIKWHRVETSYEAVLSFCANVRAYHPVAGMWPYQMRYVLKTLGMPFRVRKKFTIDDMDQLLSSGGSCILVYDTPRGGHAVFVDAIVNGGYRTWNRRLGTPPFMSREDMQTSIKISTRRDGGLYVYTFQALKEVKK